MIEEVIIGMHFGVSTGYFSASVAQTRSHTVPYTVAGYFFVSYLVTFIGRAPSPFYGRELHFSNL